MYFVINILNDMKTEFNPKQEIKDFLMARRDENYSKRPSIHYLKSYADLLLNIAVVMDSKSEEMSMQLTSVKMNLKIFKSDLTGSLQHDYDKDNKRYLGNWRIEKEKVDSIKFRLLKIYDNIIQKENTVD